MRERAVLFGGTFWLRVCEIKSSGRLGGEPPWTEEKLGRPIITLAPSVRSPVATPSPKTIISQPSSMRRQKVKKPSIRKSCDLCNRRKKKCDGDGVNHCRYGRSWDYHACWLSCRSPPRSPSLEAYWFFFIFVVGVFFLLFLPVEVSKEYNNYNVTSLWQLGCGEHFYLPRWNGSCFTPSYGSHLTHSLKHAPWFTFGLTYLVKPLYWKGPSKVCLQPPTTAET